MHDCYVALSIFKQNHPEQRLQLEINNDYNFEFLDPDNHLNMIFVYQRKQDFPIPLQKYDDYNVHSIWAKFLS